MSFAPGRFPDNGRYWDQIAQSSEKTPPVNAQTYFLAFIIVHYRDGFAAEDYAEVEKIYQIITGRTRPGMQDDVWDRVYTLAQKFGVSTTDAAETKGGRCVEAAEPADIARYRSIIAGCNTRAAREAGIRRGVSRFETR